MHTHTHTSNTTHTHARGLATSFRSLHYWDRGRHWALGSACLIRGFLLFPDSGALHLFPYVCLLHAYCNCVRVYVCLFRGFYPLFPLCFVFFLVRDTLGSCRLARSLSMSTTKQKDFFAVPLWALFLGFRSSKSDFSMLQGTLHRS